MKAIYIVGHYVKAIYGQTTAPLLTFIISSHSLFVSPHFLCSYLVLKQKGNGERYDIALSKQRLSWGSVLIF